MSSASSASSSSSSSAAASAAPTGIGGLRARLAVAKADVNGLANAARLRAEMLHKERTRTRTVSGMVNGVLKVAPAVQQDWVDALVAQQAIQEAQSRSAEAKVAELTALIAQMESEEGKTAPVSYIPRSWLSASPSDKTTLPAPHVESQNVDRFVAGAGSPAPLAIARTHPFFEGTDAMYLPALADRRPSSEPPEPASYLPSPTIHEEIATFTQNVATQKRQFDEAVARSHSPPTQQELPWLRQLYANLTRSRMRLYYLTNRAKGLGRTALEEQIKSGREFLASNHHSGIWGYPDSQFDRELAQREIDNAAQLLRKTHGAEMAKEQ